MRSARRRLSSSPSRALSQHPSTRRRAAVLAAAVLLSLFAVAQSRAQSITSISWDTGNLNPVVVGQLANPVFYSGYTPYTGVAHIEVRDANEAGLPIIPFSLLPGLAADINLVNGTMAYPWYAPYIGQDDDNTPDQQEIIIRLTDNPSVQSPTLQIALNQAGGCGCDRDQGLIATLPPVDGAAIPTAVTLRVSRQTPLGSGISFAVGLPVASQARLEVFDLTGRRLRTISNGMMSSGVTTLAWDGRDDAGRAARAGIVFARLWTPREVRSTRLVLGAGMR